MAEYLVTNSNIAPPFYDTDNSLLYECVDKEFKNYKYELSESDLSPNACIQAFKATMFTFEHQVRIQITFLSNYKFTEKVLDDPLFSFNLEEILDNINNGLKLRTQQVMCYSEAANGGLILNTFINGKNLEIKQTDMFSKKEPYVWLNIKEEKLKWSQAYQFEVILVCNGINIVDVYADKFYWLKK